MFLWIFMHLSRVFVGFSAVEEGTETEMMMMLGRLAQRGRAGR